MKILLIHQYFLQKNGSGGSRFNEMVRVWSEQGNDVTVLSGMIYHNSGKKYKEYKGKVFAEEFHSEKVRVIRCHDSEGGQNNFFARLRVYFVFVLTSMWAGFFKAKGKYDIIIVTSPPLFVGITAYFLSVIKRIPFVFEIRDLWPESAIDTGVLRNPFLIKLAFAFEKFIYKKAKLINVLTPAFRDILIYKKLIPKEKIIFIPNAADFSLSEEIMHNFNPLEFRESLGIDIQTTIITYVGAHGVANGLDQILETAQLLNNKKVLFLLIGDGMLKKKLENDTNIMRIKNVKFIPPVSKKDVFKYILASDIGASVLKKNDTFKTVYSNKTFDYMSCKKPILMAIDGVSRQLVNDANAGLFVEPENPNDFAEKITFYLDNKDLLVTHGENGYNYAREHFDRSKLASKYLNIISNLLHA